MPIVQMQIVRPWDEFDEVVHAENVDLRDHQEYLEADRVLRAQCLGDEVTRTVGSGSKHWRQDAVGIQESES